MKTKKILIALAVMSVFSFQTFAGPQSGRGCSGGGGCRPCHPCHPYRPCHPCRPYRPCHPSRPCPPPPCHRYYGCGNSGVRLAADIVSLVGASLNILRGPVAVPVAAVPAVSVPVYNNGYVPVTPVYR